jgi:hypothetical protein
MILCDTQLVYLGFVAAGEEIEQLFGVSFLCGITHFSFEICVAGYDDNNPDPDMSCRDSIWQDIRCLKKVPCFNMWLAFKQSGADA